MVASDQSLYQQLTDPLDEEHRQCLGEFECLRSEPSGPFYTNCNAGTGGNGVGSNFIQSGEPNYGSGTTLRLDQPSTIVAVSMNTGMTEAYSIRHDSAYHIVINTIYLTGNGGDSVDHEFLPAMSKVQNIGPLPYQSATVPRYPNPAFPPRSRAYTR